MAKLDPAELKVLLAIARRGTFRRAAVDLGVTPSGLSHALRALEERLALRLVHRTTRSVSLSEAGAWLVERVSPAFATIAQAVDELAAFRGTPMGALRLNAAESAARLVLMPILGDFLAAHPQVKVEIVAQTAMVDVFAEGFDAGLRFGETIAVDMIAVPIGPRQRFAATATPAYFERNEKPATPNDLMRLPCIRYRFDSGADYDWEFERSGVEIAVRVEGPFATNSQELMIEAALDGIGIAYVFEGIAQPLIASGRLVRVLEEWCPYFPGLYLYYPSRRHMPTALRAFIDFARRPTA